MRPKRLLRVYVDTSVIGGCKDAEFQEASNALMELARKSQIRLVVSDLVVQELVGAPEPVRRMLGELPQAAVEYVSRSEESRTLFPAYLREGVVGPSQENDAHHVAMATIARVDAVVSWNFKDLVHWEKARRFSGVNLLESYATIDIRSPREFVES